MYRALYLICLVAVLVNCAPLEKSITLYDTIAQKCPAVATSDNFKNQPLFNTCRNWEKIKQVQELKEDTKNDVFCLLYFISFTQYCNQSKKIDTILPSINSVSMSTACDNLDIIPKQIGPEAAIRKIIGTKEDCKKLCNDGFGFSVPMCSTAYYYNNLLDEEKSKNHMVPVLQKDKDSTHMLPVSTDHKSIIPKPSELKVQEAESQAPKLTHTDKVIQDSQTEKASTTHKNSITSDEVKSKDISKKPLSDKADEVIDGRQISVANDQVKKIVVTPNSESANKLDNNVVKNENKATVNEEKNKVQSQEKPVVAPTSPKTDETVNIDNNQHTQLDKNINRFGEDDFAPSEEIIPGNIGESEEDPEDLPNPVNEKSQKPMQLEKTDPANFATEMDGDSYFFTYFMLLCLFFIVGYVCYHNKQKILALILEGRRGKRQYRGRRPNSANYHKLDSNLEEAITSSCNKNTNNVIY